MSYLHGSNTIDQTAASRFSFSSTALIPLYHTRSLHYMGTMITVLFEHKATDHVASIVAYVHA
jgi:hypothetical protein